MISFIHFIHLFRDDSELARTFESINNTKIKITRHRAMEDGCIWEEISLMNAY